jgi:hypothetical protein
MKENKKGQSPIQTGSTGSTRSHHRVTEKNGVAQKYSEAPKMLNQARMVQHFLIPTASNGSPLSVLLRRDFARGGSLGLKAISSKVARGELEQYPVNPVKDSFSSADNNNLKN